VQAKRQKVIKEGMQLDEKQASFWPVCERCAEEPKQLDDRKLVIIQDCAKNFMTADDA